MIRFLINIPLELKKDLKVIARKQGATLNGLIRQILWEWANNKKG